MAGMPELFAPSASNALDFAKPPAETRVAVAMSGGVDSSVVAAMMKEGGFDVIGLTMQLYDHGAALAKKGACCAGADIHDARRVAATMGFAHYVLDYENLFREAVMDEFADAYLAGATPIPCIRCNERVKFKDLMELARDLDADCLATGHYIRRIEGPNGPELHRAADAGKDQSYFLFTTTREQLDYLRFPLGGLPDKAATRALATKYGLAVADKPDSQDICFVPEGRYTDVIEKLRPGASQPGDVVHLDGRVLAQHPGVLNYTIGQRRGLGISGGDPLYVVKLDAEKRQVIVGPREALGASEVRLHQINWLGDGDFGDCPREGWDVTVKVRSTRPPKPARIVPGANGSAVAYLSEPEDGVAPGQACVFYAPEGSRVLGGGWITGRG
jgi:tRNA-specific 2-thiouridylase